MNILNIKSKFKYSIYQYYYSLLSSKFSFNSLYNLILIIEFLQIATLLTIDFRSNKTITYNKAFAYDYSDYSNKNHTNHILLLWDVDNLQKQLGYNSSIDFSKTEYNTTLINEILLSSHNNSFNDGIYNFLLFLVTLNTDNAVINNILLYSTMLVLFLPLILEIIYIYLNIQNEELLQFQNTFEKAKSVDIDDINSLNIRNEHLNLESAYINYFEKKFKTTSISQYSENETLVNQTTINLEIDFFEIYTTFKYFLSVYLLRILTIPVVINLISNFFPTNVYFFLNVDKKIQEFKVLNHSPNEEFISGTYSIIKFVLSIIFTLLFLVKLLLNLFFLQDYKPKSTLPWKGQRSYSNFILVFMKFFMTIIYYFQIYSDVMVFNYSYTYEEIINTIFNKDYEGYSSTLNLIDKVNYPYDRYIYIKLSTIVLSSIILAYVNLRFFKIVQVIMFHSSKFYFILNTGILPFSIICLIIKFFENDITTQLFFFQIIVSLSISLVSFLIVLRIYSDLGFLSNNLLYNRRRHYDFLLDQENVKNKDYSEYLNFNNTIMIENLIFSLSDFNWDESHYNLINYLLHNHRLYCFNINCNCDFYFDKLVAYNKFKTYINAKFNSSDNNESRSIGNSLNEVLETDEIQDLSGFDDDCFRHSSRLINVDGIKKSKLEENKQSKNKQEEIHDAKKKLSKFNEDIQEDNFYNSHNIAAVRKTLFTNKIAQDNFGSNYYNTVNDGKHKNRDNDHNRGSKISADKIDRNDNSVTNLKSNQIKDKYRKKERKIRKQQKHMMKKLNSLSRLNDSINLKKMKLEAVTLLIVELLIKDFIDLYSDNNKIKIVNCYFLLYQKKDFYKAIYQFMNIDNTELTQIELFQLYCLKQDIQKQLQINHSHLVGISLKKLIQYNFVYEVLVSNITNFIHHFSIFWNEVKFKVKGIELFEISKTINSINKKIKLSFNWFFSLDYTLDNLHLVSSYYLFLNDTINNEYTNSEINRVIEVLDYRINYKKTDLKKKNINEIHRKTNNLDLNEDKAALMLKHNNNDKNTSAFNITNNESKKEKSDYNFFKIPLNSQEPGLNDATKEDEVSLLKKMSVKSNKDYSNNDQHDRSNKNNKTSSKGTTTIINKNIKNILNLAYIDKTKNKSLGDVKEIHHVFLELQKQLQNVNILSKEITTNEDDYFNLNTFLGDYSVVVISGDLNRLGIIEYSNSNFSNKFNFNKVDLENKDLSINEIIPYLIARNHEVFLQRFLKTSRRHIFEKWRIIFATIKQGFIKPIFLRASAFPFINKSISFIGLIKSVPSSHTLFYPPSIDVLYEGYSRSDIINYDRNNYKPQSEGYNKSNLKANLSKSKKDNLMSTKNYYKSTRNSNHNNIKDINKAFIAKNKVILPEAAFILTTEEGYITSICQNSLIYFGIPNNILYTNEKSKISECLNIKQIIPELEFNNPFMMNKLENSGYLLALDSYSLKSAFEDYNEVFKDFSVFKKNELTRINNNSKKQDKERNFTDNLFSYLNDGEDTFKKHDVILFHNLLYFNNNKIKARLFKIFKVEDNISTNSIVNESITVNKDLQIFSHSKSNDNLNTSLAYSNKDNNCSDEKNTDIDFLENNIEAKSSKIKHSSIVDKHNKATLLEFRHIYNSLNKLNQIKDESTDNELNIEKNSDNLSAHDLDNLEFNKTNNKKLNNILIIKESRKIKRISHAMFIIIITFFFSLIAILLYILFVDRSDKQTKIDLLEIWFLFCIKTQLFQSIFLNLQASRLNFYDFSYFSFFLNDIEHRIEYSSYALHDKLSYDLDRLNNMTNKFYNSLGKNNLVSEKYYNSNLTLVFNYLYYYKDGGGFVDFTKLVNPDISKTKESFFRLDSSLSIKIATYSSEIYKIFKGFTPIFNSVTEKLEKREIQRINGIHTKADYIKTYGSSEGYVAPLNYWVDLDFYMFYNYVFLDFTLTSKNINDLAFFSKNMLNTYTNAVFSFCSTILSELVPLKRGALFYVTIFLIPLGISIITLFLLMDLIFNFNKVSITYIKIFYSTDKSTLDKILKNILIFENLLLTNKRIFSNTLETININNSRSVNNEINESKGINYPPNKADSLSKNKYNNNANNYQSNNNKINTSLNYDTVSKNTVFSKNTNANLLTTKKSVFNNNISSSDNNNVELNKKNLMLNFNKKRSHNTNKKGLIKRRINNLEERSKDNNNVFSNYNSTNKADKEELEEDDSFFQDEIEQSMKELKKKSIPLIVKTIFIIVMLVGCVAVFLIVKVTNLDTIQTTNKIFQYIGFRGFFVSSLILYYRESILVGSYSLSSIQTEKTNEISLYLEKLSKETGTPFLFTDYFLTLSQYLNELSLSDEGLNEIGMYTFFSNITHTNENELIKQKKALSGLSGFSEYLDIFENKANSMSLCTFLNYYIAYNMKNDIYDYYTFFNDTMTSKFDYQYLLSLNTNDPTQLEELEIYKQEIIEFLSLNIYKNYNKEGMYTHFANCQNDTYLNSTVMNDVIMNYWINMNSEVNVYLQKQIEFTKTSNATADKDNAYSFNPCSECISLINNEKSLMKVAEFFENTSDGILYELATFYSYASKLYSSIKDQEIVILFVLLVAEIVLFFFLIKMYMGFRKRIKNLNAILFLLPGFCYTVNTS